ncbi:hypothetical protein J422_03728 [Methanocaldococcus villosus KIN24-T80]|uniref:MobA-like NTP transferase domain-containing protein n=1 Tax=Methanocaldococcus villosus KIN24-T80 TaxID=1069083 RepID=N6V1I8_9EURY|nr:adenosylcobinamide-phosphate guanylyltransferase [Methanocaldococcus villosus]ENN96138.1 hypothetical protein J422_03728 [Methanocaldococcus villosus KIN24-T80]
MDALVMAGGKGKRLGGLEKPLIKINKKHLIDYIISALNESKIKNIYVATSPYTQRTKEYLKKHYKNIFIIETPGNGYIEDLNYCIKYFKEPFLTVCSDIINLNSKLINDIIDYYRKSDVEALNVMIPKDIYPNPHLCYENLVPAGINIVSPKKGYQKEGIYITKKLIFNINTKEDLLLAKKLFER